jgi:hypothetical protein
MTARLVIACALAVSALLAGCESATSGTAITSPESPTEPSFPTSRPTRPTAAPPATTIPTAPAEDLPPENGYVFIETKSGKTRCQLSEAEVGCEAQFSSSPIQDGVRTNGVRLTAEGAVQWVVGNLGAIPAVTLDYRTYHAVGWTIAAGEDGTRFSNDRTGHGMFVSIDKVETF